MVSKSLYCLLDQILNALSSTTIISVFISIFNFASEFQAVPTCTSPPQEVGRGGTCWNTLAVKQNHRILHCWLTVIYRIHKFSIWSEFRYHTLRIIHSLIYNWRRIIFAIQMYHWFVPLKRRLVNIHNQYIFVNVCKHSRWENWFLIFIIWF